MHCRSLMLQQSSDSFKNKARNEEEMVMKFTQSIFAAAFAFAAAAAFAAPVTTQGVGVGKHGDI